MIKFFNSFLEVSNYNIYFQNKCLFVIVTRFLIFKRICTNYISVKKFKNRYLLILTVSFKP